MAKDYVADNLAAPSLDHLFPNMIEVDKSVSTWPWLRRDIDHAFRVDRRNPIVGFINRDEASILYSNARLFAGCRGIEIGAWRGWSTAHLIASGLSTLHVVEPLLADPDWRAEFLEVTRARRRRRDDDSRSGDKSGGRPAPRRIPAFDGRSPSSTAITTARRRPATPSPAPPSSKRPRWSSSMISSRRMWRRGCAPSNTSGWNVMAYQTAQMLGVAWRGEVAPVAHKPDPTQRWSIPDHLKGIRDIGRACPPA